MTGVNCLASIAPISSIVAIRTPDAPCARLASFSAIISRAMLAGIASPTPAAWLSTMLRWSVCRSSSLILTLASFPKPVLIPYTGSFRARMRATAAALAMIRSSHAASSTGVSPR